MSAIRKLRPKIVSAMVGTAGHVDHGKTALVELLTGCNTDRLPEEKARGLTIDLGFAPCQLPGGRLVGIVDVPGHRDFIRNMVAGAASIDVLMLVVAADDGIMPQTIEHMKIVALLRSPRVMAVVTKSDLAGPERTREVAGEVAGFLATLGFPDAPVIPESNRTFEGLDEVRDTLERLVAGVETRETDSRAFRMNVERRFSVEGRGAVVTGIPVSGEVREGDAVEVLPAGVQSSVRSIQNYKIDSAACGASACAALNLRGLDIGTVDRGHTVAAPGVYRAVDSFVASVQLVSETVALGGTTAFKLHTGTSAVNASVRLIGAESMPALGSGFAHVRLETPVVIAASDRFVLRAQTPAETVGGGVVLSVVVERLRRGTPGLADRLSAAKAVALDGQVALSEMLASTQLVWTEGSARFLAQRREGADSLLGALVGRGEAADLGGGWIASARVDELADQMRKALARFHRSNPLAGGMPPATSCAEVGLAAKSFDRLADALAGRGVVVRNGRLALEGFAPALDGRLSDLRGRLLDRLGKAGPGGVAKGSLTEELGASDAELARLLRVMAGDGEVWLASNFVLSGECRTECLGALLTLFERGPVVEMSAFKSALGLGRNAAVAILEAFDAEGVTRRTGGGRVLVKGGKR